MTDSSTPLFKRIRELYSEGGSQLLLEGVKSYIYHRIMNYLPYFPSKKPISIMVGGKKFNLGTHGNYVYDEGIQKVMPSPTDTVVEAGVYKGADTARLARLANNVVGFEPSPRNYKVAKKNLKLFDNVELIEQGLWNKNDELEIQ